MILRKRGSSINLDIHHSKVLSSDKTTLHSFMTITVQFFNVGYFEIVQFINYKMYKNVQAQHSTCHITSYILKDAKLGGE